MEIVIEEKNETTALGSLGEGDIFLDSENRAYIVLDDDFVDTLEVYSFEKECVTYLSEKEKVRYVSPSQIKIMIELD